MKRRLLAYLFVSLGFLSLALGIAGMFVPVLPTTPFLLLTAFCFMKGSKRLYSKLMNHKSIGPYIRDFMQYRAISVRVKVYSVSMLWLGIGLSIYLVDNLHLRLFLLLVAAGVSVHILCFKTKGRD